MAHSNVLDIAQFQKQDRRRDELNKNKKGSVYSRNGKLWVYFRYLNQRVREPVGLLDTPSNRREVRKKLDLITAEIDNGTFEFAKRFPYSSKKDHFTMLEGGTIKKDPSEITFGKYYESWWSEMKGGMSASQIRDYESILRNHLLPYFGNLPFSSFSLVLMKKFLAHLKGKKNQQGNPLSAKRIQNIFIPLRIIVHDAIDEHNFDLPDPFGKLKLPKVGRTKVNPFTFQEWETLLKFIRPWYQPYFEFAVQTGLRPSEQVALKWSAVRNRFIDIELSRVRGREKTDMKTEGSQRRIEIRPVMREILDRQQEITQHFSSEYVFLNLYGRPINQDKLREMWHLIIKKSGLAHRRMYETRHTFASWALAAGESPEWVAQILGHVDTSMIHRTYGRWIPNLTRRDGSAFEKQFLENNKKHPK